MRFPLLFGLLSSVILSGCNSAGTETPELGMPILDLGAPSMDLTFVGQQIDRVGRPLINLFLTDPFDLVGGMTTPQVQDAYNAAASTGWSSFAPRPYIAESLAAWDGIDGTCGNQVLAGSGATRYVPFSTVLTQDYLLLETSKTSCQRYLAVELNDPNECGGRSPFVSANVVDATLNLLQGGNPPVIAIGQGVTSDPDGNPSQNFPFLLPPL